MHIALLHYSVPPVVGGVESVLAHHARLLSRAGQTVHLFAARGDGLSTDIPLIRLPLIDSRHPWVLTVKAALDRGEVPSDFELLTAEITRDLQAVLTDVDLLIAHNVCSLNKNLALTAAIARLDRPRVILWHHDLAWTTPRYRAELHNGYPWDLLRTDWGARHVVVSDLRQRELAELLHIPLESIAVVPNGIDQATFYKLSPITLSLLQRIDLTQAAPILLLPVRLTPRKNIELALRTLAALRRVMPAAILIVTGPLGAHNPANAAYFQKLKDLRAELNLADAVIFLAELNEKHPERSGAESKDANRIIPAYLPDDVIADFYRLADALFMPSREEGFGIPIVEAAFSKLPVFCTDIEPLRALGLNEASYFSPDANPQDVAAQIADRLQHDPQYQLAVRLRRAYTWERIYTQHIAPLLEEDR